MTQAAPRHSYTLRDYLDVEEVSVVRHELINGEIVAAVFYTLPFGGSSEDMDMHVIAQPGSRWMTSYFVGAAFRYPFVQLGLRRVSATAVPEPFKRILKLLGFVQEGTKRQAVKGRDIAMFGMLREECRYA